jgi:hypothetical protein
MTDLTTIDTVEQWLGLASGNQDEALLERLISAASGLIETWCGRTFASQSYVETRDGTGGRRMAFINGPVTSVSSVMVSGQSIPPGDAVTTPGYYFSPTMLILNGHVFRRGLGNVTISTIAGYATIPAEVEQACIELVSFRYRELDRIGLASKGLAGETTAFVIKDMPPSVASLLDLYRRVVPG